MTMPALSCCLVLVVYSVSAAMARSVSKYNTMTAYSPPTRTKSSAGSVYGTYGTTYVDSAGSYVGKSNAGSGYANAIALPSYGLRATNTLLYPRRYAGSPGDENNDGVPDELDLNRDGIPDSLAGTRAYTVTRGRTPKIVYGLAAKSFIPSTSYNSLSYPRQRYQYGNTAIYA